MGVRSCSPELPSGGCWLQDGGAEHRGCFPGHERRPVRKDRAPSNTRLLLAGAYVLKEVEVVRLAAHALRASGRLASRRVARSRSAGR